MKRWGYFFLAVALLLMVLFVPEPQPVRASSSLSPGVYFGYVYFLARTDFNGKLTAEGGAKHFYVWQGKYKGKGVLQVTINDDGSGDVEIFIPNSIHLINYYGVTVPDPSGYCQFLDTTDAQVRYLSGHTPAASIGNTFQAPLSRGSYISYRREDTYVDSGGEFGGCAGVAQTSHPSVRVTIQGSLDMLKTIQFQTNYRTDKVMGGTCSLPGWIQSYPVPGFTTPYVYSLSNCQWLISKLDLSKPQKGNQ